MKNNNDNDAKILRRARELIEQGWTTRAPARDHNDNWCFSHNQNANKWCLGGAISRAMDDAGLVTNQITLERKFMKITGIHNIPSWNDAPTTTKNHVITALNYAINQLESENVDN